ESTGRTSSWSRPTSSTASASTRPPIRRATSGPSRRRWTMSTRRRGAGHSWSSRPSPGDYLLERGLVANRVEVRILLGIVPKLVRQLDRPPEVLERVRGSTGEALTAGEVVEQQAVLRMSLDQLPPAVDHLGIRAGLVQQPQRRPKLPSDRVVRLPRRPSDRDDRRPGLLGERRPLDARPDEDEGARRRVVTLAVELEDGAPLRHDVQLL